MGRGKIACLFKWQKGKKKRIKSLYKQIACLPWRYLWIIAVTLQYTQTTGTSFTNSSVAKTWSTDWSIWKEKNLKVFKFSICFVFNIYLLQGLFLKWLSQSRAFPSLSLTPIHSSQVLKIPPEQGMMAQTSIAQRLKHKEFLAFEVILGYIVNSNPA